MDVPCLHCGEPWDSYHLKHDEIHETDLSPEERKAFDGKLNEPYLSALEALGWQFCGSIYSVLRCPCCKKHGGPAGGDEAYALRAAQARVATDMFGDDEDGLIIALNDHVG